MSDIEFVREAYQQALEGYEQGGAPIGAVMVRDGKVIARGRNKRVQEGDPVMHGETDCLRNAGIIDDYSDITLYTTLSPCMMCTGAIIHFGRQYGVEVVLVDDDQCKQLMARFIREKPEIWYEDIAGNETV